MKKSRQGPSNGGMGVKPNFVQGQRTAPESFAQQLAMAVAWAQDSGWPGGKSDVRTAARIYHALADATRDNEGWRLALCQALYAGFAARYGDVTVAHRVALCATLIEHHYRRDKARGR